MKKGNKDMNVYEIGNMGEKLSANRYPGRGIVLEPDGIRTEDYDPS